MSRRGRLMLFALAGAGFAAVLVIGMTGLPDFGSYHGVYGQIINGIGVTVRHATDLVNRMKHRGVLLSTDGPLHNVIKIKPPLVFS